MGAIRAATGPMESRVWDLAGGPDFANLPMTKNRDPVCEALSDGQVVDFVELDYANPRSTGGFDAAEPAGLRNSWPLAQAGGDQQLSNSGTGRLRS
jgi:hypothetical protein